MKKIIFSMALCAATIFASCSKDSESITNELTTPVEGSVVTLSLKPTKSTSRSIIDDISDERAWENQINFVDLYAYTTGGAFVTRVRLSSSDIENGDYSLPLPNISAGDYVWFVALANLNLEGDVSQDDILNTLSTHTAAEYNGAYGDISTGAQRPDGFVMSGSASITIAPVSEPNNLSIHITRLVSKLAVESSITYKNIDADDVAGVTYVESVQIDDKTHPNSCSQLSGLIGGKFYNLFYLTPYDTTNSFYLRLNVVYDADRDPSTTDDQTRVQLTKVLSKGVFDTVNTSHKYRFNIEATVEFKAGVGLSIIDWDIRDIEYIEGDWYVNA